MDINEIKQHLLIYGDISANCANCRTIDLKLGIAQCPVCKTEFKYISFRNIKSHLPKMHKLNEERPGVLFVDHEDFKRNLAAFKAKEFLK